jgi:hypothetical protein
MNGYQSGREAAEDGRRLRYYLTAEYVVVDAESREQKTLRSSKEEGFCLRVCIWCFK